MEMEMVFGIAIGAAAETLILMGVVFVGMRREDAGWRDRWAEHKKIATDRVNADRERFRCMDMICTKRQQTRG